MGKSIEARQLLADQPVQAGAAGDPVDAEAVAAETRYETVGGLDFNQRDPGAEVGNGEGAEAGFEQDGFAGAEASGTEADGPLPDALSGSYDLAEAMARPRVIIGTDDRVRVGNTTLYPWRAICALRITAANGRQYIGTGFFVSPRTVITAGHCVYMHNEGGWARSIEVIPGMNDAARPFGSAVSRTLRSVSGWTQSRNREFDYGAIILPANARLGDRTGFFGFAVRNDAALRTAALNLSGYPGDKGGAQQWFMAQRAKALSARVITYDIDTMGGQSGSPVWVMEGGARYAVGIHTNGAGSGNSATRIEGSVFARLSDWKNQGL